MSKLNGPVDQCIVCGKSREEVEIGKGQFSCRACHKIKKRDYVSQKRIKEILAKGCKCGEKRNVFFLTWTPISTIKSLDELNKLTIVCLNCLIDNQKP